jgi:hypothetical protein
MLKIYNPQKRILILKNKKGKIVQAFGGEIAKNKWKEILNTLNLN